jgi:hypothetical protein
MTVIDLRPTKNAPFSLLAIDLRVQVDEPGDTHISRVYSLAVKAVAEGKEPSFARALDRAFQQSERLRGSAPVELVGLQEVDSSMGKVRVLRARAAVSSEWRQKTAGPIPSMPDEKSQEAWMDVLHRRCLLEWGKAAPEIEIAALRGAGALTDPVIFELEKSAGMTLGHAGFGRQREVVARFCSILEKTELCESLSGANGGSPRKARSL